jgi:hypothetical protein
MENIIDMIRIIASAAVALMLGSAALVAPTAPASAASVSINVGNGGHHGRGYVEPRRHYGKGHVERRRHCSVKKIVTHRNGKRIVRTVKTCR